MKIIRTETIYRGRKFDFAINTLLNSSGQSLEREFVQHPGSVVLVPLLAGDRVALLRNYRHTLDRVLFELPAGTRERVEPWETCAHRELKEETGFTAGKMRKVLAFHPAPGLTDEEMAIFVAENLTAGSAQPEADEQMEVEIVPFDQALAMTHDGRIHDGKTMIGLWLVARMRAEEKSGS